MFPNPQDALPLPPHPSLERYRKIAKDLVKACRPGDPSALRRWTEDWVNGLVKLAGLEITPGLPVDIHGWIDSVEAFARRQLRSNGPAGRTCALADAQFVLARSHGFPSWPKFAAHLEELTHASSPVSRFEAAADAIVSGDAETLRRLLGEEPALISAQSTREHGATLLHYVSANGVEGYRQRTPKNIVEIAAMLLRAGAEVDAAADVYGGGCTALDLTATSWPPERAGVQEALMQALLEFGAKIDAPPAAGRRQTLVAACLGNGRGRAAEFIASQGAHLGPAEAAGLGRLEEVKSFFAEDGALKAGVQAEQMMQGFHYACQYGRNEVVEFLIGRGADVAARGSGGQTGLHWAVIGGHLETVKLLLRHNPPLEEKNDYGGTAVGQALWSAAHGGDPDLYVAILETLVAAGARLPERHLPVNERVDAWLERHGSLAVRSN